MLFYFLWIKENKRKIVESENKMARFFREEKTNWLYWVIGAVVGYEVFLNPNSPIYYSNISQTLSNMSAVASGLATNVSTAVTNASTTPTVNANSFAPGGNTSIEDVPITFYSKLMLGQ